MRPTIDFADAAAQPLVLQSRRYTIRQRVEEAAAARGVALNIAHEHDSARVIRSLYACGGGFTFTPACALGDAPASGTDWMVARVVNPEMTRSYTLATAADREVDGVMQVVMDALEAVVQEYGQAVISTGGGAPCFFDNIDFMNRHGRTFFLDVPVEVSLDRGQRDVRDGHVEHDHEHAQAQDVECVPA